MNKKKDNKQLAASAGATDSAAATAALFASDKVAATIAKVQWSGRDNPNWALPRRDREES